MRMKKAKQLARFLEILKAVKSHDIHSHTPTPAKPHQHLSVQKANRVVKGLESGNDMKSNYRQR